MGQAVAWAQHGTPLVSTIIIEFGASRLIQNNLKPLHLLYIVVCSQAGGTPDARLKKTRKENRGAP